MHKLSRITMLFFLALLLSACGATNLNSNTKIELAIPSNKDILQSANQELETIKIWPDGETKEDTQGSVTIKVTAQNLNEATDTIDFFIAIDTHSVDLNMDLASLSTLATDNGLAINALFWDAPSGGHHVKGILSFPANVEDLSILENSNKISLTIHNLDADERIFIWQR